MPEDAAAKDIAAKLADIEKKLVTRERVEEIAAAAALDVLKIYESEVKKAKQAADDMAKALEKREFARRVAASFDDRVCRRTIDDLVAEAVQDELEQALARNAEKDGEGKSEEELEQKIEEKIGEKLEKEIAGKAEAKVGDALSARLPHLFEDPEFTGKLKELAGGKAEIPKGELDEFTKRLAARMDKIEKEALPQLVERLVEEKLKEKPGGAAAQASFQGQGGEVVKSLVLELASSPEFKAMLNEKFKVVMEYLAKDIIPKQIRRIMGG